MMRYFRAQSHFRMMKPGSYLQRLGELGQPALAPPDGLAEDADKLAGSGEPAADAAAALLGATTTDVPLAIVMEVAGCARGQGARRESVDVFLVQWSSNPGTQLCPFSPTEFVTLAPRSYSGCCTEPEGCTWEEASAFEDDTPGIVEAWRANHTKEEALRPKVGNLRATRQGYRSMTAFLYQAPE